jgi:hypothetical protein
MDKKMIGDWIMYYEVQRLKRQGLSSIAIGKALVIDRISLTHIANHISKLYRVKI